MPEKAQDVYGPFGSVPTERAGGGGATPFSARANPGDFGAQVGAAVSQLGDTGAKVGQQALEVGTHFAQMATEAKVNDDYANKYVPAAVELRNQFDSLEGQDKIHGYESYMSGLQSLNKQFTGNSKSPYETQLMGALINRHVEGEAMGAKRELVEAQKLFAHKSTFDAINADNDLASRNYNDPQFLDDVAKRNENRATIHAIDGGFDPNTPEGKAQVEQVTRMANSDMAVKSIDRAISTGDVATAYKIRQGYSEVLPADQQLHIDNVLHDEATRQNGKNTVDAIKLGQPVPESIGAPPAVVQAAVANTAHAAGVDTNHALTVARIESSMGQNLGTRGDIGQTGKGGNLPTQASNMVNELKRSGQIASNTLGREAQPWEQYLVYQQGSGGGPALLKAKTDNPTAKAVDVLKPLYKNPKDALSAIVNNGGNATMTSGDYLNFIHQKYEANAERAKSDLPQQENPGDAILTPHQDSGEVVQPAATPRQALINFDEKVPSLIARINAIPNYETRKGVMQAFTDYKSSLQGASNAYTQQLVDKAEQLAADPNFTDMGQVPPTVRAALAVDHPETLRELRNQADANKKYTAEVVAKDAVQNSPNYYYNLQRTLQEDDTYNHITNENQLHDLLGRRDGNGISLKDYSDLKKSIVMPTTLKNFLAKSLKQIEGANGNLDGEGGKRAIAFYNSINHVMDSKQDIPVKELVDPQSKNYVGKLMDDYMLPREMQVANSARKMQAEALKKTVPARQPGETPEQYLSRLPR